MPRLGPRNGPEGRRRFVTAVRPDDLRLQPGAARLRVQGPDLAQRGRARATSRSTASPASRRVLGQRIVRVPAGPLQGDRGALDAAPERPPLRQRQPHQLLRAGRRAREAHLPPRGRQHLNRRTDSVGAPCALVALAARARARSLPAAAAAQDPPPSLTVDTVFSLPGVEHARLPPRPRRRRRARRGDRPGARPLLRRRAHGDARGDTDIAIVARRADGSLDPSFATAARSRSPSRRVATTTASRSPCCPITGCACWARPTCRSRPRTTWRSSACSPDGTPDPDFGTGRRRALLGRRRRRAGRPRGRPRRPAGDHRQRPRAPRARTRSSPCAPPTAGRRPRSAVGATSARRGGGPTAACPSPGGRTARSR